MAGPAERSSARRSERPNGESPVLMNLGRDAICRQQGVAFANARDFLRAQRSFVLDRGLSRRGFGVRQEARPGVQSAVRLVLRARVLDAALDVGRQHRIDARGRARELGRDEALDLGGRLREPVVEEPRGRLHGGELSVRERALRFL
jgi:hypothetical protein